MCRSLWKTPDAFQCNHCLFPPQTDVLDAKMGFFADVMNKEDDQLFKIFEPFPNLSCLKTKLSGNQKQEENLFLKSTLTSQICYLMLQNLTFGT